MKLPYTTNSTIRHCLRLMWLRSRERGEAIKRDKNTCQICGKKGSVVKGKEVHIDVHHLDGINWDGLINDIRSRLLQHPSRLKCVCRECHAREEQKH